MKLSFLMAAGLCSVAVVVADAGHEDIVDLTTQTEEVCGRKTKASPL